MESPKFFKFFSSTYYTAMILVIIISCLLPVANSETLHKTEIIPSLPEDEHQYDNIAEILGDLFTEEIHEDDSEYLKAELHKHDKIAEQNSDNFNNPREARTYNEVAAVSHGISKSHPHISSHVWFRRKPHRRTDKHDRRHKKKVVRKWKWGNPKQKRKGTKNHNYKLQKPNTDFHYAVHTVG